jgi:hypothetical protein
MAMTAMVEALRLQARTCAELGSLFSAGVLERIAGDVEADGPFAALLRTWADRPLTAIMNDAAPLRILGGLHHLVLTGAAPKLAAGYPEQSPQPDWVLLDRLIPEAGRDHAADLAAFIQSPPQTNEVRRSLCLCGGFLTVAAEMGAPLRCFEIGASAGLNLNWDYFRYEFGAEAAWGDPGSPVRLSGDWTGAAPPLAPAHVISRAGCDRAPVDLGDPAARTRLQAYVWADQRDRLDRLRAAITLAGETGVSVARADAGEWVDANVKPESGAATVLYHSVVWQYLPPETQARIERAIGRAAAAASDAAPFAWLRMEPVRRAPAIDMELRLTLWPGGQERRLAQVHAHGAWVRWTATL